MDQWSVMFKKHLNEKDRKLIPEIYEKTKILSYHTDDYKQLSSLSECLVSLMVEPQWAPLLYTLERLNITVDDSERGNFQILKEKQLQVLSIIMIIYGELKQNKKESY